MLLNTILKLPFGYKFKKSALKHLAPGSMASYAFTVPFYGYKYHGQAANAVDLNVLLCGAYEKFVLHFWRDYLTKRNLIGKAVAFDVGANVGNHALFLSTICANVHAFEPYPPVQARLMKHVTDNKITNLNVHDMALGSTEADLPFYAPPAHNLGTGSFIAGHNESAAPIGMFHVHVGDTITDTLNLQRLDLIKIDVEGAEPDVLRGLSRTLATFKPLVIFEVGETTASRFGTFQDIVALFPVGYQFYAFDRVNRDSGAYHLVPYSFGTRYASENVIASATAL